MQIVGQNLISIILGIIIVDLSELVFYSYSKFTWPSKVTTRLYLAEICKLAVFGIGLSLGLKALINTANTLILTVIIYLIINFIKNLLKLKV